MGYSKQKLIQSQRIIKTLIIPTFRYSLISRSILQPVSHLQPPVVEPFSSLISHHQLHLIG